MLKRALPFKVPSDIEGVVTFIDVLSKLISFVHRTAPIIS